MKIIDDTLLDGLASQASSSPRRRANHNIHDRLDEPVQRFLNAIEPDSLVPVHRHSGEGRWELFLILRGRGAALLFDDDGRVRERHELDAGSGTRALEIPSDTWHTVISLEPGTVYLEIKEGPYQPVSAKEFAPWSPREGDLAVQRLLTWLASAHPGDYPPALD